MSVNASERETWLPAPGYESIYEVSDRGRVRSLTRYVARCGGRMKIAGRMMALEYRKNTGYYAITLSKDGEKQTFYVHRLVLMTFRGQPLPGQEGCHENDIRTDNRLENLRWDTHLANVHDCIKRGRNADIGRMQRDKTSCDRGHPFDEANTKWKRGGRCCRKCERMLERARYHKKKADLGIPSRAYKPLPGSEDTQVA